MTSNQNTDIVPIEVYAGPGVAPTTLTYVTHRFGALQQFAPRPITRVDVRVTRPRDTTTPGVLRVGASLSIGDRLLRAEGVGNSVASAVDLAYDRLRRQLVNLPHGRRGDYVPHHRAAHLGGVAGDQH